MNTNTNYFQQRVTDWKQDEYHENQEFLYEQTPLTTSTPKFSISANEFHFHLNNILYNLELDGYSILFQMADPSTPVSNAYAFDLGYQLGLSYLEALWREAEGHFVDFASGQENSVMSPPPGLSLPPQLVRSTRSVFGNNDFGRGTEDYIVCDKNNSDHDSKAVDNSTVSTLELVPYEGLPNGSDQKKTANKPVNTITITMESCISVINMFPLEILTAVAPHLFCLPNLWRPILNDLCKINEQQTCLTSNDLETLKKTLEVQKCIKTFLQVYLQSISIGQTDLHRFFEILAQNESLLLVREPKVNYDTETLLGTIAAAEVGCVKENCGIVDNKFLNFCVIELFVHDMVIWGQCLNDLTEKLEQQQMPPILFEAKKNGLLVNFCNKYVDEADVYENDPSNLEVSLLLKKKMADVQKEFDKIRYGLWLIIQSVPRCINDWSIISGKEIYMGILNYLGVSNETQKISTGHYTSLLDAEVKYVTRIHLFPVHRSLDHIEGYGEGDCQMDASEKAYGSFIRAICSKFEEYLEACNNNGGTCSDEISNALFYQLTNQKPKTIGRDSFMDLEMALHAVTKSLIGNRYHIRLATILNEGRDEIISIEMPDFREKNTIQPFNIYQNEQDNDDGKENDYMWSLIHSGHTDNTVQLKINGTKDATMRAHHVASTLYPNILKPEISKCAQNWRSQNVLSAVSVGNSSAHRAYDNQNNFTGAAISTNRFWRSRKENRGTREIPPRYQQMYSQTGRGLSLNTHRNGNSNNYYPVNSFLSRESGSEYSGQNLGSFGSYYSEMPIHPFSNRRPKPKSSQHAQNCPCHYCNRDMFHRGIPPRFLQHQYRRTHF